MKPLPQFLACVLAIATGTVLLVVSLLVEPIHPAISHWPWRSALAVGVGLVIALAPAFSGFRRHVSAVFFGCSHRTFLAVLYFSGFAAALAVSLVLFDGLPRLDDGVSSIFQARIFLAGKLYLPLPAQAEFFDSHCVIGFRAGLDKWCSMYPPGWPALLVPGVLIGATWLINPIIHGFLCVLTSLLGAELFGSRTGRIAGLLCVTSPILTSLGGEQLSYTTTAAGLCLCAWSVCRLLRTGGAWSGLWAGVGWGVAFLCRPLSSLVVGACIAVYVLAHATAFSRMWKGIAVALLPAILSAATLAWYQHEITGDFRTPGHKIGMGRAGKMGFVSLGPGRAHTIDEGWDHTTKRMRNINRHLLGWPVPFYLIALSPFLLARARGREYWLLAPSVGLLLVFSAFWYYEQYYPSCYMTEGMPMLLVLAASALTGRGKVAGSAPDAAFSPLSRAVLCSGLLFAGTAGAPKLLSQFHEHYGDVESVLPRVVATYDITNAVMYIDGIHAGVDRFNDHNSFYASGFMLNDLSLTGSVIYAKNMREKNISLMRHFPDRRHYLYRFNRRTARAVLYDMFPVGDTFTLHHIQPKEPHLLE